MNAWKATIAAAAAVAVAAPLANASLERSLPIGAHHAKVVHHKRVAPKAKPAPRVIMIIGQPVPVTQPTSADDCVLSGNNCTDEQLCDLWGMSCDKLGAASATDAAVESQNPTG
jgi:hypothetical protein